MRPSALTRIMNSPSTDTDSSMMRESAPCVTTTSFRTMRSISRRSPASTTTCSIIRSSICAVPLTAVSRDEKISGKRDLGEKSETAEIDARESGMSDFACAIRPAVPRRVPSPPSTTIMSTCRGSLFAFDDLVPSRGASRFGEQGGVGIEDGADVSSFEPRRNLLEMAGGPLEPRLWPRCRPSALPHGSSDGERTRGCRCRR